MIFDQANGEEWKVIEVAFVVEETLMYARKEWRFVLGRGMGQETPLGAASDFQSHQQRSVFYHDHTRSDRPIYKACYSFLLFTMLLRCD